MENLLRFGELRAAARLARLGKTKRVVPASTPLSSLRSMDLRHVFFLISNGLLGSFFFWGGGREQ